MSDFLAGLIVLAAAAGILVVAVEAWDTEADARRAQHERFLGNMDSETKRIVGGGK